MTTKPAPRVLPKAHRGCTGRGRNSRWHGLAGHRSRFSTEGASTTKPNNFAVLSWRATLLHCGYIGIRGEPSSSPTIAYLFFSRWGRVDEATEVRSGGKISARARSTSIFEQTVEVRPQPRVGDYNTSQDLPIEVLPTPLCLVFATFDFRRKMADSALA